MPLTLGLFTVVLLIGTVSLMFLRTLAGIIQYETRAWNLRNEVEQLQYDYQLQLMHSGSSYSLAGDEPIGVDIVEDPER